jgi:hypothetical protein
VTRHAHASAKYIGKGHQFSAVCGAHFETPARPGRKDALTSAVLSGSDHVCMYVNVISRPIILGA